MDPRYDDPTRSRTPGGHIPIPDAADPSQRTLYNRASSSSFHGFDPNQARYSHYSEHPTDQGYGIDPEEYRRDSYHHQPYEPSPADIPLLPRDPRQNQFYETPDDVYRHSHTSFHTDNTLRPQSGLTPAPSLGNVDDGTPDDHLHRGNAQASRHLVYDCPVPPRILKNVPHAEAPARDEFTHMRYSAVTCDPEYFVQERFDLRPQLFTHRRRTELFIVVTMYNEDDVLFARTMAGVFKNIEFMCTLKGKHNGLWDKDGWKKIVVCVINDGRVQLNPRTRAVMTALGCYQHKVAAEKVNGKKVEAHVYEYTTKVGIELSNGIVETRPGAGCPVQMIFCLKETNAKKINSHRWALQAFGQALQPNVVVLLDAGTRPGKDSIYELWKAFDLDPQCGGACGEIKAMLGKNKGIEKLLNPIIAAQNFEYKMSNILDKPMESSFGFISVLPGAFSAYRFLALQNDASGKGPLEKYFDGEKHHLDADIFTKNMYLAEDRILCFELVAKRKSSWVLTYVCSATGETDVPEEMPELVKQRRRWLNGSFFAGVYALVHFFQIFRSSHSMMRKIMFMLEFIYQLIAMIFAWFAVGNFFLVFQILTTALSAPDLLGKTGGILSVIIEWVYLGSLVTCFVLSLGNTPDGSRNFYMTMVYTWALIMAYLMFASVFISVKSVQVEAKDGKFTFSKLFTNSLFFTLIVSLLSTYVLWIFISIVFLDPWHILHSSIQYLLLSPTYTNVINVYAFCNTHDVSWGTRPDEKPAESLKKITVGKDGKIDEDLGYDEDDLNNIYDSAIMKFATAHKEVPKEVSAKDKDEADRRGFRTYVVLFWMFCNAALVAIVLKAGGINRLDLKQPAPGESSGTVKIYLLIVLWSVAGLSGFKFVGAMWYKIKRIFKR